MNLTRFLFCAFVCCLANLAAGCASREKKASARMDAGDSPNITYTDEREAAGGPFGDR